MRTLFGCGSLGAARVIAGLAGDYVAGNYLKSLPPDYIYNPSHTKTTAKRDELALSTVFLF